VSRVDAMTPRFTPFGPLCRVSFTNPFTSRAIQSLLSADTRRRYALLHRPEMSAAGTLQSYVAALGGQLRIVADFGESSVELTA